MENREIFQGESKEFTENQKKSWKIGGKFTENRRNSRKKKHINKNHRKLKNSRKIRVQGSRKIKKNKGELKKHGKIHGKSKNFSQ